MRMRLTNDRNWPKVAGEWEEEIRHEDASKTCVRIPFGRSAGVGDKQYDSGHLSSARVFLRRSSFNLNPV